MKKTTDKKSGLLVKFNAVDRDALWELSQRLDRSQSATIRILVRETLEVLKERDVKKEHKQAKVK